MLRVSIRADSTNFYPVFFLLYFSNILSCAMVWVFFPPQERTQSNRCQLVLEEPALVPVSLANKAAAERADT